MSKNKNQKFSCDEVWKEENTEPAGCFANYPESNISREHCMVAMPKVFFEKNDFAKHANKHFQPVSLHFK